MKVNCICAVCGRQFEREKRKVIARPTCGYACSGKLHSTNRKLNCIICGTGFSVVASRIKRGAKFCGMICAGKAKEQRMTKPCDCCGKDFTLPKRLSKKQKFCSKDCRAQASNIKIAVSCAHCEVKFERVPSDLLGKRAYCSYTCRDKGQERRVRVDCSYCGEAFYRQPSKVKGPINYCSATCRDKGHGRAPWIARAAGRISTLYLIRLYDERESFYKIGITFTSIKARYAHQKALLGYNYEIIAKAQSMSAERIFDWEQSIIRTFTRLRYTPSRKITGHSECFINESEILAIFPL